MWQFCIYFSVFALDHWIDCILYSFLIVSYGSFKYVTLSSQSKYLVALFLRKILMWKSGIHGFINNVHVTSSTVFHSVMLGLHHNPQWPLFQRFADVFYFYCCTCASGRKDWFVIKKIKHTEKFFLMSVNVVVDTFVPPFLCCGFQHGGKLYLWSCDRSTKCVPLHQ